MCVTGHNQFTALIREVPVDQCAIANFLAAGDRFAVFQRDGVFRTFEMLGCKFDDLQARIAARQLNRFTHDRSRAA